MKTPRSASEVEKIREEILSGALAIIVREGFDAFTMRKLAGRIGMTAPNIYNYFENKDEIYLHLVIRGFGMLLDALRKAFDDGSSARERARDMVAAYLRFGMENAAYYEVMFSRPAPKYTDYLGTPLERLSAVEYRTSMEIARLARKVIPEAFGMSGHDEDELTMRVIQVWSVLHGMVSLYNSKIVGYVAGDKTDFIYDQLIDELFASIGGVPGR